MNLIRITLVLGASVLAACTSVQQSNRISTDLQVSEYNSIGSRYMERPTFVSVEKMSDGDTVLNVHMDTYRGRNQFGIEGSSLRFSKEDVAEYTAAIDKFVEWASLARERKDAFTKEIARAPTWASMGKGTLRFTFYSGNEYVHLLTVTFCAGATCLEEDSHYYTVENAKKLRSLLQALAAGTLRQTNIDSVYR